MDQKPKLMDQVHEAMRSRHYSRRTEEAYAAWIKRFIFFHNKRHPSSMGGDEVNAFLSWLATEQNVSASTQNQALGALLFLYRHVLDDPLPWLKDIVRATRPSRLPVVMTPEEVRRVLSRMAGPAHLVALLLYGSGLRLLEGLMLRVKDVDFERGQIHVRDPKGRRDRHTMLPQTAVPLLRHQLELARAIHEDDLRDGFCSVWIPEAIERRFRLRRDRGDGNGFFRRARAGGSRAVWSDAITSTRAFCSGPSRTHRAKLVWTSG